MHGVTHSLALHAPNSEGGGNPRATNETRAPSGGMPLVAGRGLCAGRGTRGKFRALVACVSECVRERVCV